jgi:uncharacterized Zn finger protein
MIKYIGDSCAGCSTYRKYKHLIKWNNKKGIAMCESCLKVVPSHIPLVQHKRFLRRLFNDKM